MSQIDTKHWIRTCQECGHKQKSKPPAYNTSPTDAYRNTLCKSCNSPALDYGSYQYITPTSH